MKTEHGKGEAMSLILPPLLLHTDYYRTEYSHSDALLFSIITNRFPNSIHAANSKILRQVVLLHYCE